MERYFKASLGIVMLAALGMSVACKTEKKGCTGCCELPGITKEITMPISKEKVTLQFYNVMTPANYPYYEYDAKGNKIDGTHRPNYDTTYDVGVVGAPNDVFEIGNYDPQQFRDNNLRTFLRIETEGDTSNIWPANNRLHKSNNVSCNYGENGIIYSGWKDGLVQMSNGTFEIKYHASGRYKYKFLIYDTLSDTLSSTITRPDNPFEKMSDADSAKLAEDDFITYLGYVDRYNKTKVTYTYGNRKERLKDSVVGVFCVIRNDYDCPMSSCVGKDSGDPLLK